MAERGFSQRRVCELIRIDSKTVRRGPDPGDGDLRARLRSLAAEQRRFGCRRFGLLLEREGVTMNRKKLSRLCSEEGLAERQAAEGALPDVTIRNGRLVVAPLRNATPETVRDLARRLYGLLPRVHITDLIKEVDGWTGMSDCFGHLRTGQPAPDRRALYAAIIADGVNLGLTRMAEACEGTTYWRLARLVDWHIREDAYAVATRMLVEAQARAPIAALWGDGSTSSSDGQQHRAAGCNLGVAATILWNTIYLVAAIEALRRSGVDAPDGLLRHVWPLGWCHVSLTSDYRWNADNPKDLYQLHPLRCDVSDQQIPLDGDSGAH